MNNNAMPMKVLKKIIGDEKIKERFCKKNC